MTISASPTPYERLEIRDGIFFYRKLSRRGGALALAAPKHEVIHHEGTKDTKEKRNRNFCPSCSSCLRGAKSI